MNRFDLYRQLEGVYNLMPETRCNKTSCASWCCTKLESSKDAEGFFMPLPLVYAIEYLHIRDHLDRHHADWRSDGSFRLNRESRVCPFKDPYSPRCRIYPVRPFSCRVYGRRIPPVFWGMEVDPSQALSVFCPDTVVTEPEKVTAFDAIFPKTWQWLTKLSALVDLFENESITKTIKDVTGGGIILILAFGEFDFLARKKNPKWFTEHFPAYWKKTSRVL